MQRHEWREKGEDGVRLYRVDYHASRWAMSSRLKSEEEWTHHDPMTVEDWKMLRGRLMPKYQRKRLPWTIIEQVDKQLAKLGVEINDD